MRQQVKRSRVMDLQCSECGYSPVLIPTRPNDVWMVMRPHFAETGHQRLGWKEVYIPAPAPTLPTSPGAHRRARRILARRYGKDWEGPFRSYKLERRIATVIFAKTELYVLCGLALFGGVTGAAVVDIWRVIFR